MLGLRFDIVYKVKRNWEVLGLVAGLKKATLYYLTRVVTFLLSSCLIIFITVHGEKDIFEKTLLE